MPFSPPSPTQPPRPMRAKAAMPGTRWGYGAHSALEQMVQDTARRPGADRRDERITAGRKPR